VADTTYIVLRRVTEATVGDDRHRWVVADPSVPAASAEAAIRKAATDNGTFVAIPARSFKPAPPFAPKPKPSSG
jgi:hypothetical protein